MNVECFGDLIGARSEDHMKIQIQTILQCISRLLGERGGKREQTNNRIAQKKNHEKKKELKKKERK
jgi:hypothetical protein